MADNRHFLRDANDVVAGLGELNARFAGKTIVLTGAAGFLGVQFVHYFAALNDSGRLARRCRLLAMDNYLRGLPKWIEPLRGRDDLEFAKADVISYRDYPRADYVIHAASVASPIFYRKYPIETMDANVLGLRNLLEHARAKPVESFLFFSSSEIYGDPDPVHIPTDEEYRGYVSCTGPRACYDESKRYGETLCVNFHRVHKVPVKVARPFNNYGPGLRVSDRRVLPDFFRDVLAQRDITLLSDGRATRTFCYVADAIEGYLRILLQGRDGEAYNIGTAQPEISMRDLAAKVIEVSGAKLKVAFARSEDREYLSDNPQRRCPSIAKAMKELGYSPRVGLEEGLRRTYEYYRDHADE
jgi:nucleoside-diphosphate-sugar epimerase